MENDKNLKQILSLGAAKAPADFTAKVMLLLPEASPKAFVYKPLIPGIIQKIFLILFLAVIVSIVVLSMWIALADYHFNITFKLPEISAGKIETTCTTLVIFWIVFAANRLVSARVLKRLNW